MDARSYIWWLPPFVLALLRLLYAEARMTRATVDGRSMAFRASLGVRITLALGIIGFSTGTLISFGHEKTWLLMAGALLALSAALVWPATIITDDDGIHAWVWWRKPVALRWEEIVLIQRNKAGDMEIFGAEGRQIVFTRFHIDPQRFSNEVTRRANLRIRAASDGPSLR